MRLHGIIAVTPIWLFVDREMQRSSENPPVETSTLVVGDAFKYPRASRYRAKASQAYVAPISGTHCTSSVSKEMRKCPNSSSAILKPAPPGCGRQISRLNSQRGPDISYCNEVLGRRTPIAGVGETPYTEIQ